MLRNVKMKMKIKSKKMLRNVKVKMKIKNQKC